MRPHLHAAWHTRSLMRLVLLATLPAALVGTWNLGRQTLLAIEADLVAFVPAWLGMLAATEPSAAAERALIAFAMGLGTVLPLLAVALGTSAFWAAVFARARNVPVDSGWLLSAWLLVWLLPPGTTLGVAVLAVSFGTIVGLHVFGGTGRYLVSPALLGVLFVHFGYPEFVAGSLAIPGTVLSDWSQTVASDGEAPGVIGTLLGVAPGGIGTGSALACLLGALLLVARRFASWRVLAGALLGILVSGTVIAWGSDDPLSRLAPYRHVLLGNFAFLLAFIATDPSPAPLLRGTRWLYGALFGALTVMIRILDPTHPEGSLFALLLAGLAVPLIDHLALRRYRLVGSAP